jgi:hypothetical protein
MRSGMLLALLATPLVALRSRTADQAPTRMTNDWTSAQHHFSTTLDVCGYALACTILECTMLKLEMGGANACDVRCSSVCLQGIPVEDVCCPCCHGCCAMRGYAAVGCALRSRLAVHQVMMALLRASWYLMVSCARHHGTSNLTLFVVLTPHAVWKVGSKSSVNC